jgi:UDPglucose 6-dehydrogenase
MVKSKKIGIIGVGYVGGAVRAWFERSGSKLTSLFLYDKYKKIGSLSEIDNRARVIFLCVPTPYIKGKGYDDSALREVISGLRRPKIIVVKSTVLPGSTEKFQKKYPRHTFLFNPEFLVAKSAVKDFLQPHRQIMGYTSKSKKIAKEILALLPKAPIMRVMPATEAELVKYFGNAFLATKVIFANQMYDICKKLGLDYDTVKEAAAHDPRIGPSHLTVLFDGYRGYSGNCFPKDVKSIIDFSKQLGLSLRLLSDVDIVNESLLRNNKKNGSR